MKNSYEKAPAVSGKDDCEKGGNQGTCQALAFCALR